MKLPTDNHLPWICRLNSGADLSGEAKARLGEHMMQMAEMLSQGEARVELAYTHDAVTVRFWPEPRPERIGAIHARAHRESRGFLGLVARVLLMRHGRLILDGRLLQAELAAGYLGIEQRRILDGIASKISDAVALVQTRQPSIRITYDG